MFTYAALIWFPNAPFSGVLKLQRIQNSALRLSTGSLKMASQSHFHSETQVLPSFLDQSGPISALVHLQGPTPCSSSGASPYCSRTASFHTEDTRPPSPWSNSSSSPQCQPQLPPASPYTPSGDPGPPRPQPSLPHLLPAPPQRLSPNPPVLWSRNF